MTQNQIAFKQAQETERHNLAQEEIGRSQNTENVRHNKATESISSEQTDVNRISANANALQAQTAKNRYLMEHDIEYGWTGSEGYPAGMPLSAQKKNFELQYGVETFDLDKELKEAQIANERTKAAQNASSVVSNIIGSVFGKQGIYNSLN